MGCCKRGGGTRGLVLIAMLAVPEIAGAQPADQYLVIDPTKLDDSSRASLVTAISQAVPAQAEPVTVSTPGAPDRSLWELARTQYNYGIDSRARDAVAAEIRRANDIGPNQAFLRRRTTIVAPALPVASGRGAIAGYGQLFQLHRRAAGVIDLTSCPSAARQPDACRPPRAIAEAQARTWILQGTPDELRRLTEKLPQGARRRIAAASYQGYLLDDTRIHPLPGTHGAGEIDTLHVDPLPPDVIQAIRAGKPGRLILFDIFPPANPPCTADATCKHGLRVADAASEVFSRAGLPDLAAQIVRQPLSLLGGNAVGFGLLADYIARQPTADSLASLADAIKKAYATNSDLLRVPVIYLQALYASWLQKVGDRDVLSISFYLQDGPFKVLPEPIPVGPQLVAAVLDEGTFIEETLFEPQESFYLRRDGNFILVGAPGDTSHPTMSSKTGSGVTCAFAGSGFSGSTITTADFGTSYAAPAIAAALVLARAYWAGTGTAVDSREVKARLMLAANVSDAYVEKYASGGLVQLDRLLRKKGPFFVTPEGAIHDAPALGGTVSVMLATGTTEVKLGATQLRGLAFPEGVVETSDGMPVFVFFASNPNGGDLAWRRATLTKASIRFDASETISNLTIIASRAKEIIYL